MLSFSKIYVNCEYKHDVAIVDLPLAKRRNNWYLESLRNTSKNNICKHTLMLQITQKSLKNINFIEKHSTYIFLNTEHEI